MFIFADCSCKKKKGRVWVTGKIIKYRKEQIKAASFIRSALRRRAPGSAVMGPEASKTWFRDRLVLCWLLTLY